MRKLGILSAIVLAASATVSFAQTAATPSTSQVRTPLTQEQRAELRKARIDCRAEVKVDASDRRARAAAMRECVDRKSPTAKQISAERDKRRTDNREVARSCRESLRGRTLSGDERRTAMQSCIVAKQPERAKSIACSNQARDKSLKRGKERNDFMRSCLRA